MIFSILSCHARLVHGDRCREILLHSLHINHPKVEKQKHKILFWTAGFKLLLFFFFVTKQIIQYIQSKSKLCDTLVGDTTNLFYNILRHNFTNENSTNLQTNSNIKKKKREFLKPFFQKIFFFVSENWKKKFYFAKKLLFPILAFRHNCYKHSKRVFLLAIWSQHCWTIHIHSTPSTFVASWFQSWKSTNQDNFWNLCWSI